MAFSAVSKISWVQDIGEVVYAAPEAIDDEWGRLSLTDVYPVNHVLQVDCLRWHLSYGPDASIGCVCIVAQLAIRRVHSHASMEGEILVTRVAKVPAYYHLGRHRLLISYSYVFDIVEACLPHTNRGSVGSQYILILVAFDAYSISPCRVCW